VDPLIEHIHYLDILEVMSNDVHALYRRTSSFLSVTREIVLAFLEQSAKPTPFNVLCSPYWMSLTCICRKPKLILPSNSKLQGLHFFLMSGNPQPSKDFVLKWFMVGFEFENLH
jgi:hypothetical protein